MIAGLDPNLVTPDTIDRARLNSSIRTHTRDIRHERWPKGPWKHKQLTFRPLSLPCEQAYQATPSGPGSSAVSHRHTSSESEVKDPKKWGETNKEHVQIMSNHAHPINKTTRSPHYPHEPSLPCSNLFGDADDWVEDPVSPVGSLGCVAKHHYQSLPSGASASFSRAVSSSVHRQGVAFQEAAQAHDSNQRWITENTPALAKDGAPIGVEAAHHNMAWPNSSILPHAHVYTLKALHTHGLSYHSVAAALCINLNPTTSSTQKLPGRLFNELRSRSGHLTPCTSHEHDFVLIASGCTNGTSSSLVLTHLYRRTSIVASSRFYNSAYRPHGSLGGPLI